MDVGVIGVGAMGKNHVRVYSELKSVGTLAVCDVNAAAARAIGKQHGAEVYSSVAELLRHVDAVNICVPTPYHVGVAREVFAAGKHAFIEKPLCATAAEARMLMAAVSKEIVVGVGHIERFNPIVSEIRKIVTKPLYVELKRHNPASARVTGTSVVEDLMIHDIDIVANVFFPEVGTIRSMGNADLCSVQMDAGGVPVSLSASRKASKKIRLIYIEDEEFTVEGDFMSQEVTIYRKPGQYRFENERYVQENIIEKVMVNKVEPLKVELSAFLDCAKSGRSFPVTPAQAIRNLDICEQIRAGFASGAPV